MATSCLSKRHAPGRVRRRRARGRVLESVDNGLEQKNDEKMNQDVRSGGAFVETWRPFEADQALQAFYDVVPVPIQERFVSHPTLNHKPLPKEHFNAYARKRGESVVMCKGRVWMRGPRTAHRSRSAMRLDVSQRRPPIFCTSE